MAIGGCEVSYCFLNKAKTGMERVDDFLDTPSLPDLTDVEEARKAIIASEILNRKY